MKTKKYIELTINQKINYKSGWDIAIAYECRKVIGGSINKPYCKLALCLGTKKYLLECVKEIIMIANIIVFSMEVVCLLSRVFKFCLTTII